MKKKRVAKFLPLAAQCIIFVAAPGLIRAQGPAPQMARPSASSSAHPDPYAEAFAGLTYNDKQKEAINKIQQDIATRKAAVLKSVQLDQDQKDAMLLGYTRIQYISIYKELTAAQQKQVSSRLHALRVAEQQAHKAQAPTQ